MSVWHPFILRCTGCVTLKCCLMRRLILCPSSNGLRQFRYRLCGCVCVCSNYGDLKNGIGCAWCEKLMTSVSEPLRYLSELKECIAGELLLTGQIHSRGTEVLQACHTLLSNPCYIYQYTRCNKSVYWAITKDEHPCKFRISVFKKEDVITPKQELQDIKLFGL